MSRFSTTFVAVVGHSLGGAIALLDGVYLDLQLPTASVSVISYGMPRGKRYLVSRTLAHA